MGFSRVVSYLVALCLEPLEDLLEAPQAGLPHAVQGVGPFGLAEVGRPVAARGVQDVRLVVHVLDHEELPLQQQQQHG